MDPDIDRRRGRVRLHDVAKRYTVGDVTVTALEGVDLEVAPASFVVILGPSGSGKTTLLNLIGALDAPSEGRVEVAGRDISDAGRGERFAIRRHAVSFVFQSFNLFPGLTAIENVAFGAEVAGRDDPWAAAEEVLDQVGLAALLGMASGYAALRWLLHMFTTDTFPEHGVPATLAPTSLVAVLVLGVGVATVAPVLAMRRLLRTDIPSTLRVLE